MQTHTDTVTKQMHTDTVTKQIDIMEKALAVLKKEVAGESLKKESESKKMDVKNDKVFQVFIREWTETKTLDVTLNMTIVDAKFKFHQLKDGMPPCACRWVCGLFQLDELIDGRLATFHDYQVKARSTIFSSFTTLRCERYEEHPFLHVEDVSDGGRLYTMSNVPKKISVDEVHCLVRKVC